jgi:omega-6 fatty acid desaturase (delta-12 desaturase)
VQHRGRALVGFIYLIFNPRFTWLKGSIGLVIHMLERKLRSHSVSMKKHASTYETRYWKSAKEYWHMFWNNVVLLSLWGLMCWAFGTTTVFYDLSNQPIDCRWRWHYSVHCSAQF